LLVFLKIAINLTSQQNEQYSKRNITQMIASFFCHRFAFK